MTVFLSCSALPLALCVYIDVADRCWRCGQGIFHMYFRANFESGLWSVPVLSRQSDVYAVQS
jgi:hypothetical protein